MTPPFARSRAAPTSRCGSSPSSSSHPSSSTRRSTIRDSRIGTEVVLERWMEIVGEPGLRLCPLQIARRFVNVERRHPGDLRGNQRVEHLSEQHGIGLTPQTSRPTEAVCLVSVVVVGGEVLAAIGDRCVGNAIPVLDARRAEACVVERVRLLDARVMSDAQSHLVRFVEHAAITSRSMPRILMPSTPSS
jgi:hypothetical protein